MIGLKTSIIIPCYNEEPVIPTTVKQVKTVLERHFDDYEMLFIDDGSSDNTFELLQSMAARDPCIKILSFSRNFGHQPAIAAGLQYCTGDIAIVIDADLQDPPELFPDMVRVYQDEECNVVYGVRQDREGETFFKKLNAKLFYRFMNYLADVQIPVDTGDFRLVDREIIDAFNRLPEKNKYIRGLISWLGYRQVPFFYQRKKRYAGRTKFSLWRMLRFAETGIFYFSKKPLTLAIILGFICLVMGLFLAAYTLLIRIIHPQDYMTGWASLMIVSIFFGGVQLLTIGILGKYIGNIFDEVKRRPEYIIADKTNIDS